MCVTVVVGDAGSSAPRWDRDQVAIVISPGLDHFAALRQARAMLTWLGAPQLGLGAICWCGDHVTIPSGRITMPQQKAAPAREEIPHAR